MFFLLKLFQGRRLLSVCHPEPKAGKIKKCLTQCGNDLEDQYQIQFATPSLVTIFITHSISPCFHQQNYWCP
jgi:hypothetical protein